jgi:hypothetical protein
VARRAPNYMKWARIKVEHGQFNVRASFVIDLYLDVFFKIRNPQSAIRNPQSAIRNPQSAIRSR